MSQQRNGHGRVGYQVDRLVVVQVEVTIEPRLSGRSGGRFESPPQPPEHAMA
jgi:hypothetical protein